jgi:hypothetical protein
VPRNGALLAQIRQDFCEVLQSANTLAYFGAESTERKKSLIKLTPVCSRRRHRSRRQLKREKMSQFHSGKTRVVH